MSDLGNEGCYQGSGGDALTYPLVSEKWMCTIIFSLKDVKFSNISSNITSWLHHRPIGCLEICFSLLESTPSELSLTRPRWEHFISIISQRLVNSKLI